MFRQGLTLSCVDKEYFDKVIDLKISLTMVVAVLDDAADYSRDREFLDKAYEIIFHGRSFSDEKLEFFGRLWEYILSEMSKLPRFGEFLPVFEYDVRQMFNAMYYSHLINTNPKVMNLKEAEIYIANNMISYLYIDLDLMASPSFNANELPFLREIVWYAQQMARIGNWLSTWRRELKEGDFSSGVFAYLVSNGYVSPDELPHMDVKEIEKLVESSDSKRYFMDRWRENYRKVYELGKRLKSVDVNTLLKGFENLLKFHLATEGYK